MPAVNFVRHSMNRGSERPLRLQAQSRRFNQVVSATEKALPSLPVKDCHVCDLHLVPEEGQGHQVSEEIFKRNVLSIPSGDVEAGPVPSDRLGTHSEFGTISSDRQEPDALV